LLIRTLTFAGSLVAIEGIGVVTSVRVAPWPATLQRARPAVFWADCSTCRQNRRIPLEKLRTNDICFSISITQSACRYCHRPEFVTALIRYSCCYKAIP